VNHARCEIVTASRWHIIGQEGKSTTTMPNEPLPNKREVMLALLAETSVFVHLDPRGTSVRVPPWFKNQPQLVLQIGLNMPVKIPDLDIGEQGITCTLSFSRRPFFCSIPWTAVFGLVGDNGPGLVWPDDVPAEIAAQVQAQTGQAQTGQAQTGQAQAGQAQPGQGKKPAPKEAGRGRLRAVGSEPPSGPTPVPAAPAAIAARPEAKVEGKVEAEVAAKVEASPVAAPAPVLAEVKPAALTNAESPKPEEQESAKPSRSPGASKSGSKRELPPYLRVVK
jgi:hypothetical protein